MEKITLSKIKDKLNDLKSLQNAIMSQPKLDSSSLRNWANDLIQSYKNYQDASK